MRKLPSTASPFLFAVLQSALTCAVASAIAVAPHAGGGQFLLQWAVAWLSSWMVMVPVVIVAAPLIRRLVSLMTRDPAPDTVDLKTGTGANKAS